MLSRPAYYTNRLPPNKKKKLFGNWRGRRGKVPIKLPLRKRKSVKFQILHILLSIIVLILFSVLLYYAISYFPIPQALPYLQIIQNEENFQWLRFLLSVLFSSGYCFVGSITSYFKHIFHGDPLELPFGLSFLSVSIIFGISSVLFLIFIFGHGCDKPFITFQVQGISEQVFSGSTVPVAVGKKTAVSALASTHTNSELICTWEPEKGVSVVDLQSCNTLITKVGEGVSLLTLQARTQTCDVFTTHVIFIQGIQQ
jgi:hypothetical protein